VTPQAPDWRRQMASLIPRLSLHGPKYPRRLIYALGPYNSHHKTWVIEFWQQELQANGQWSVLKMANVASGELADLDPGEQQLLRRLFESFRDGRGEQRARGDHFRGRMVVVPSSILPLLLPALAMTGRFGKIVEPQREKRFEAYEWDTGGPWWPVIEGCEVIPGQLTLRGRLRRGNEDLPISRQLDILPGGIFRRGNKFAEIEAGSSDEWLKSLQQTPEIVVPEKEVAEALTKLTQAPACPAVELDRRWQQRIGEAPPQPALRVTLRPGDLDLPARLLFGYGSLDIAPDDPHEMLFDTAQGKVFRRARSAERDFVARLPGDFDARGYGILSAEGSAQLLDDLAREGWRIGTTDRRVHGGGTFTAKVETGIDWFDLGGTLRFDGQEVQLPALLQAVREGRGWVNLADGSVGLLPAGWAERWAALVELSRSKKNLRFAKNQALVIDSLLRNEKVIETDAVFGRIRQKLRSFSQLEPVKEPPGFLGELRPYQRLGLGWLELLAELQLGGCLADDMGLGKTVQVLAWLLRRKQQGLNDGKPFLLVVPRSLVFNWVNELKRFTPDLSFVVSHGGGRENVLELMPEKDVVITTYGTLVRDIDKLRLMFFDTLVIDEAQAVKNRGTQAAEACAAVQASQRLALTGTPVENHLGELWSIFDFLNPGLLGGLPKVSQYAGRLRLPPAALAEVAEALRPLILRRTKNEVLKELPAKTEQTIFCELGTRERKAYDELRVFYQTSLEQKIEEVGLASAKIWVLEALLRLRQAACHPGLLDKKAENESSAKLDTLLETLEQVLEEGHKAIVFSQFTTLLGILRKHLDARGQTYEYLDGKTRDREARVGRFQNDPDLKLFLISLKAGGVGLNLTAASYVFLLDPWWNPAVEAQAIDRAHRIGQEQPVFAYRLIAENTVEEKIIKLQEDKRNLADAIVAGDSRVMKQLTAEDLKQLLG
jgi:superfamily II DNA or RNA helicase